MHPNIDAKKSNSKIYNPQKMISNKEYKNCRVDPMGNIAKIKLKYIILILVIVLIFLVIKYYKLL